MLDIFYNTHIMRNTHDFIIAGARADYFAVQEKLLSGITAEKLISVAENNIRDSVQRHYDSIYQKALTDNPEGGVEEATRIAINDLNETIFEYLPDLKGDYFMNNVDECVSTIFMSNAFAYWKLTMKSRFIPFTNTAIPTKVLMYDISGGDINISERDAEQEMEEATLIDILQSLNSLTDERS